MDFTREVEPDVSRVVADRAAAIEVAYAAGKRAWPDIPVSYEQFRAHVAQMESSPASVQAHGSEYYLCVACALGMESACQQLDATYLQPLASVASRLLQDLAAAEDVLQDVRARLLAASPARIASYRGSGSLAGWLRTIVVHACQDYLRAKVLRRNQQLQLQRWQLVSSGIEQGSDTEGAPLRHQRNLIVRQAWHAAIRSLSLPERRLLHHYFVSGHSIDVLSQLYSGHRATMARRIRRATAQVSERVRQALQPHYTGLDSAELQALVRDCGREIDLMETLVLSEPQEPRAA
jgi:RNA polymerase sigma-70 factor